MPQASLTGPSWQGSLSDLANIILHIKRVRAFGRLSLRNNEHFSIAHLYFRAGRLVHIIGHRGDARSLLYDLRRWRNCCVRFDCGVVANEITLNDEHERLLEELLVHLHKLGLVALSRPQPQVIDSNLVLSHEARELIAHWEWEILSEATRRVSLAVAHLVGPGEAMSVLQDILDDCSSAFPAFACLEIASTGYLAIEERSQLDRLPREELLEGFTALMAICQCFCAPIVGEKSAHRLMIQALQEIGPILVNMGVFRVDTQLLASGSSV